MDESETYHRRERIPTRMRRRGVTAAMMAICALSAGGVDGTAYAQFVEVPEYELPAWIPGQPERLRSDPRGAVPAPPASVEDLAQRFFPQWRSEGSVRELEVSADADERLTIATVPGYCYAALALGQSEDSDIDLQVWEAGTLRDEDLARDHYPRVQWCAEREEAELRVESYLSETQQARLLLLVDPRSTVALGEGANPMERRMSWAAQLVAPRAAAWSADRTLHFERPGIVAADWVPEQHEQGCLGVVAVASPGIEEFDLLVEGPTVSIADYRRGPIAAIVTCEASLFAAPLEIAVHRGTGEVRYRVFLLPPIR